MSDADTAPDELEFELVEAPVHGELVKTDGDAHASMRSGEAPRVTRVTHVTHGHAN